MKGKIILRSKIFLVIFPVLLFANLQCQNGSQGSSKDIEKPTITVSSKHLKPPSSSADTLQISGDAAVFYHPDSAQLDQFRQQSSKNVYETVTHESFFQMRNARTVLKKYWPKVNIIEAKLRYLRFIRADSTKIIIDLDSNPNMYGLYLFAPQKEPEFVDMMNIETALGFYFK